MAIFKKKLNVVSIQKLQSVFCWDSGGVTPLNRSLVGCTSCSLELRRGLFVFPMVTLFLVFGLSLVVALFGNSLGRLVRLIIAVLIGIAEFHHGRNSRCEVSLRLRRLLVFRSLLRDVGFFAFLFGLEPGPDIQHLLLLVGSEFVFELKGTSMLSLGRKPLRLIHVNYKL